MDFTNLLLGDVDIFALKNPSFMIQPVLKEGAQ